ncbi:hypothetical protein [Ruegeria atlantica]|uniref:hypothetical protein n=1 Tax=Ruegeria atlantica TaxID=81569 RepID=UPI00147BCE03|nr:hypothetical protein [Ruegeria atlantica]
MLDLPGHMASSARFGAFRKAAQRKYLFLFESMKPTGFQPSIHLSGPEKTSALPICLCQLCLHTSLPDVSLSVLPL